MDYWHGKFIAGQVINEDDDLKENPIKRTFEIFLDVCRSNNLI